MSIDLSSAKRFFLHRPVLAIIVFGAAVSGCVGVLAWSQGAYNLQEPPARQAPPAQPAMQAPALYVATCTLCHGGDSMGTRTRAHPGELRSSARPVRQRYCSHHCEGQEQDARLRSATVRYRPDCSIYPQPQRSSCGSCGRRRCQGRREHLLWRGAVLLLPHRGGPWKILSAPISPASPTE